MDLNDFLGPKPIVIDLHAEDRWGAIDELISHLAASQKIKPELRDAIAATDLICEVVGAVGRSRKGVQFDAVDGKPVNLVMLFLVPQRQFQKHLHTLANIAKLLHRPDFRDGF